MENFQYHEFSCLICNAEFTNLTIFRNHYRSDWHIYNTHLSVIGAPSITLEAFQRKEATFLNTKQTEEKIFCIVCGKKFNSKNQYENHIASKAHKKKEQQDNMEKSISIDNISSKNKKMITFNKNKKNISNKIEETDYEIESLDSDEWLEDEEYCDHNNICLFCDCRTRSLPCIMNHMTKNHSFFIPYLEYCIDINGLLDYLEQKICTEFKCIWCNDSGRKMQSEEAVKMHMIDKGHCRMLYEGETILEYSSFYDYSSDYPEIEKIIANQELAELSKDLDDDVYMMKLPSGKWIVHRALAFYYKQNVPIHIRETKNSFHYWLYTKMFKRISLGSAEKQLEAARMTVRDVRKFQQVQTKYSIQLQIKNNKLQKHFRRQTNF